MAVFGIDLDDTLSNTVEPVLEEIKRVHKIELTKADLYKYFSKLKEHEIFTPKRINELVRVVWSNYNKIEIADKEAPKIIEKLHRSGNAIYIITMNHNSTISEWLKLAGIVYDRIIVCENRNEKLRDDVDIYIEDDYMNAKLLADKGKKVIVLRRDWNVEFENYNHNKNLHFADNWKEVGGMLQNSAKKTLRF